MFYRGPNDRETRALRRLFVVKCYDGDPEDSDCPVVEEKVIAWNQTDAIRRAGKPVVELPEAECHVTWDDKPLKIFDTAGPTEVEAIPTVEDTEGFDATAPAKKKKKKKK
jgi:hypothetical protein